MFYYFIISRCVSVVLCFAFKAVCLPYHFHNNIIDAKPHAHNTIRHTNEHEPEGLKLNKKCIKKLFYIVSFGYLRSSFFAHFGDE